jgi:hypothetical protein
LMIKITAFSFSWLGRLPQSVENPRLTHRFWCCRGMSWMWKWCSSPSRTAPSR